MPAIVPTEIVDFIDREFDFARSGTDFVLDRQFADRVSALLRLLEEMPGELVTIGGADYTNYLANVETLKTAIRTWDSHGVSEPHESRRYAASISRLRVLLSGLPDAAVSPETAALSFIKDPDLRESIRGDISYAERALAGAEWKAATILAGSAIEALLLWAIDQCPSSAVQASFAKLQAGGKVEKRLSPNPEDWPLGVSRQVAADLGVLKRAADDLVKIAQGFRNLIHPGAARRLQERCTKSTAYTAAAALTRVIEDLS